MHRRFIVRLFSITFISLAILGCGYNPRWPDQPAEKRRDDGGTLLGFEIDGAKKPNYFERLTDGRVTQLIFDDNGDGKPDLVVDRSADSPDWPHCILVLDGAAYDVVAAMWKEGRFRLFRPPTRVISVYPSMTDLALTRIFQTPPCEGPEALYFDPAANRLRGGTLEYLRGDNAPWLKYITYHAPQSVGAKASLDPQAVFDEEMNGTYKTFSEAKSGTVSAYSIGASGLGTSGGAEAIRKYMLTVEKLCERLVYEKRGRIRITLTSDHGHCLKPCKRVNFEKTLNADGFELADRLKTPADVVTPAYGLVTFAAMFNKDPEKLAATMLKDPSVDVIAFTDGDQIVVVSKEGRARISKSGAGFKYAAEQGDPLKLLPIIESLRATGKVSADGVIDDRALFDETDTHSYPDPLHRLWDCFHNLMKVPPQVAVSMKDDYCHGSWMFELGIGKVASTHGSLNLPNSSAFILSDVGQLPEAIRIDDVMPTLNAARKASLAAQPPAPTTRNTAD